MTEIVSLLFFLLIFLIVYGILNKLKIFPLTVNVVVSCISAFYSIFIYFLFAEDLQELIASLGLVVMVAFGIAFLYYSLKKRPQNPS